MNLVTLVASVFLIVAYGVAILKYRLYEIDVVINRSIVFGSLAVFITGVYVMIVVGVGSLIGDRSNVVLAVAATAFVAALFEPARQRVQRWANVLVYGVRATPYEVLASMTVPRQSVEEMISASAATIAQGVGAVAAAVFSVSGSDTEVLSVWPDDGLVGAAQWDLEIPMLHAGEEVGRVAVRKQRGDRVSPTDRRLVDEFAGQASLLLANARLNRRLSRRLEELAESRRRLVTAHDEARRKLERDLHDGAQQELVALKVKLGLAVTVARSEGAEELAEQLGVASGAADRAVEVLRDLARGIYPPLLEAEGLVAAVESLAYKSGLGVEMAVDGVGRHPRPVEAAVYFCLLEALHALDRESGDGSARISLADGEDGLRFSVGSGEGEPAAATSPLPVAEWEGIDLLRDRLDAVGGTLILDHGRYLEGVIPSVHWT